MLNLRDYQEETLNKLRQGFASGKRAQILYAPTGAGKCLGKGTPVLMADATIKAVEDIKPGDRLASPTGGFRTVLSTTTGRENLYRVVPIKGDSYVVNASHLLCLKKTPGKDVVTLADGTRIEKDQDMVIVSADVYYHSNKTARHILKGWRSAVEEFESSASLPVPPYILGVWLGDGTVGAPHITKPEGAIVDEWISYGKSIGLDCKKEHYANRCTAWRLTNGRAGGGCANQFSELLKGLGVFHSKHIPHAYMAASKLDRMELIAGLLDTDGSVTKAGYDWISANEKMANDMAFLCRSVGLSCYVTKCTKGIKSTGFVGTYWRLSINGDCDQIPCRQKKAQPRLQKKRHYIHGITLEPLGEGDYYGFELDGDKLFLLGDFTVTHNTEMAIALLNATKTKGNKAAMILDRIVLCDQTSKRLERYKIDHGVLQAGHWRYRPYEPIQVCSAQTIEKRGSFPGLSLLIVDECHVSRTQTVEFIKNNPDVKVIGLTATPFTKGLGKTYDNVVSVTTTKKLVETGVLVPLRVFIAKEIDMTGAKKVAGEWSQAEATTRGMKITGDVVAEWIAKTHEIFGEPRKTIVFSSGVEHGADLARKFQEQGYNFISLSYRDDEEWKKQIIEDFSKPDTDIQGLISVDLLSRGFDVPDVMIGVSARPFSKSLSSHIQQMGRVMRGSPGKSFGVWLCHSGNYLRFREDWDEVYELGVHRLDDGKEKAKKEPTERQKKESKCPACHALWVGGSDTCYNCGHVRERRNQVSSVAGKMEELANSAAKTKESKQEFWSMMQYYIQYEGWSSGRAANTYREMFGVWPRGLDDTKVMMPSPEVKKFVRKKLHAFLKRIGRR